MKNNLSNQEDRVRASKLGPIQQSPSARVVFLSLV